MSVCLLFEFKYIPTLLDGCWTGGLLAAFCAAPSHAPLAISSVDSIFISALVHEKRLALFAPVRLNVVVGSVPETRQKFDNQFTW